jgi:hypothetical protein
MSPLGTTGTIALAVVMLLAVGGAIYSQSDAEPAKPVCVSDEDRVLIRRQVLSAVDDALHDHMKALFLGWIKDPRDQPNRASAGLQAAIVAYQRARADALKWSPPNC